MVDRGVGDIIGDGISNGVDIDSGAVGGCRANGGSDGSGGWWVVGRGARA